MRSLNSWMYMIFIGRGGSVNGHLNFWIHMEMNRFWMNTEIFAKTTKIKLTWVVMVRDEPEKKGEKKNEIDHDHEIISPCTIYWENRLICIQALNAKKTLRVHDEWLIFGHDFFISSSFFYSIIHISIGFVDLLIKHLRTKYPRVIFQIRYN